MTGIYDERKRVVKAKKILRGINKQVVAFLLVLLIGVFAFGAYAPFEIKATHDGYELSTPRLDATALGFIVVAGSEHEVHAGHAFHVEHNATGGSGTKATISFTTPNTTNWSHIIVHMRSNVESFYTLGEGATITAASGSNYAPRNRNRNLVSITSTLISAGSAGGAGNVTLGGTVTTFGTVLETLHIGSGRQTGGSEYGIDEWILKQNTTYALEIESEAASSEITIEMHWYEHTNEK